MRWVSKMARGGINKALVANAREALIAKGQNPSIDAVRVELGNTGSKSTIHRYLKELEEEASTTMDDETLLSQPIKELVMRLAAGLRQEAYDVVEKLKLSYEEKLTDIDNENKRLKVDSIELNKQGVELKDALQQCENEIDRQDAMLRELEIKQTEYQQNESRLSQLLDEKQTHIDSLEDKYRHSREALEHYRQAVKEQRDQDHRKHEQHVRELQAEIRTLNQTLSIKQTDITQLNKGNSRLISELSSCHKDVIKLETGTDSLGAQVKSLETQVHALESDKHKYYQLSETTEYENKKLKEEVNNLLQGQQKITIQLAKYEAEIAVKDDVINRLIEEKEKINLRAKEKENDVQNNSTTSS